MTVCIAAICDLNTDDPKIVLCTDRRTSSALGSTDMMLKNRPLGYDWRCLTSGTDRDILATHRSINMQFKSFYFPRGEPKRTAIDETQLIKIVESGLFQRKRDKAEQLIQGRFAISYGEFLANGKVRLPDEAFRVAVTDVELIKIDAEFIVAGFCDGEFATLLRTDSHGDASIFEEFITIGEGGYLAQAMLLYRVQDSTLNLGKTLYNVYEAKKFSQGVPSVGPDTTIAVLHKTGRMDVLMMGYNYLDTLFEQFGPRKEVSEVDIDKFHFQPLREIDPNPSSASEAQSS